MKKKLRKNDLFIILPAILLALSYYSSNYMKTWNKDGFYDEKIEAAYAMQEALDAIKEERKDRFLPIDKSIDINETGIIGLDYSPITTTLGYLDAKRTSANPNFAAILVEMMKELDLKKGDFIAANFSGSFPGLNIAVIAAAQTLELNPIIMASVGASSYGANIPEFNYIHMEELLYDKGIFKTKSTLNSVGGGDDIGSDMSEETSGMILEMLEGLGRSVIFESDLEKNIKYRYDLYQKLSGKNIKCFVNVGGNRVSIGEGDWVKVGSGIVKPGINAVKSDSGLIGMFLFQGVPVINLLNIKNLATKYGIAIDPHPAPLPGDGDMLYKRDYPVMVYGFVIMVSMVFIYLYGRRVMEGYAKKD